jgi:dTMP kinase
MMFSAGKKKGLFCVFEGIDGSGKSTLIHTLARSLPEAVFLKEPSDLPTGKLIRKKLQAKERLRSEEWLTLFIDDRYANLEKNILPGLAKNKIILQDRYFYSTAAYQGEIMPLDPATLTAQKILNIHIERGFPEPDLLFFIDIDVDSALNRIRLSRSNTESFETQDELIRIQRNYQDILPKNTVNLNGLQPPDVIGQSALQTIRKFLNKKD